MSCGCLYRSGYEVGRAGGWARRPMVRRARGGPAPAMMFEK